MIYLKAKKFRSNYKINNKTDLTRIKKIIHICGYNLSTYSEERFKLISLKLWTEAQTAPAISVIDSNKNITVYYNDKLPSIVQRFALAHELGHIKLRHIHRNLKGPRQEREADKFAEYILSPQNNDKIALIQIDCLIIMACLCILSIGYIFNTSKYQATQQNNFIEQSISETMTDSTVCYYARYSQVYHLYRDCYYLKNSKTVYTNTVNRCNIDRLCSACKRRKNKKVELQNNDG